MLTGNIGQKLRDGSFPLGTFVTIDAPEVAELLSKCGYDFLLFDMEHSALSTGATQRLILASQASCATLVRVPDQATVWIKKVVDTGCDGIVVPLVNSRNEAQHIVRAAKYSPLGARSVGISRAQGYGANFSDYVAQANELLSVIIQIEHIQGVQAAAEILSVPGIDGVLIGPYDLSASMNLLGQVEHPDVQAAIQRTCEACRAAGVPVGVFTIAPEKVPELRKRGFDFVICGIDTFTLSNASVQALAVARKESR